MTGITKTLHITQPTLSKLFKSLENALGKDLIIGETSSIGYSNYKLVNIRKGLSPDNLIFS